MRNYSSLDGTSASKEILAFQKWANSKGGGIKETGIWDKDTSSLYDAYKKRYEIETGEQIGTLQTKKTENVKSRNVWGDAVKKFGTTVKDSSSANESNVNTTTTTTTTPTKSTTDADKKATDDTKTKTGFQSWSTTKKTIVVGGSLLGVGLAVWYFVIRKK